MFALKQIAEIDQKIQKQEENVDQSWQSLAKKCQHFQSFDLAFKWQKRHKMRSETATLVEQVKNEVSLLNVQILDKLDANISANDKQTMLQLQQHLEQYWKNTQRYLNYGIELGRQLDQLKSQVPQGAINIKEQESIASVKSQLEEIKLLGDKLRANYFRMVSVKSHLEQMGIQIEAVQELEGVKIDAILEQKDDSVANQQKKKKKKKAKKKPQMELDLDMDDDANMQTRFSEHLSPNNQELQKVRQESGLSFSGREGKANQRYRNLGTITDADEAEEGSSDS